MTRISIMEGNSHRTWAYKAIYSVALPPFLLLSNDAEMTGRHDIHPTQITLIIEDAFAALSVSSTLRRLDTAELILCIFTEARSATRSRFNILG